jgi:hypothetical protein
MHIGRAVRTVSELSRQQRALLPGDRVHVRGLVRELHPICRVPDRVRRITVADIDVRTTPNDCPMDDLLFRFAIGVVDRGLTVMQRIATLIRLHGPPQPCDGSPQIVHGPRP